MLARTSSTRASTSSGSAASKSKTLTGLPIGKAAVSERKTGPKSKPTASATASTPQQQQQQKGKFADSSAAAKSRAMRQVGESKRPPRPTPAKPESKESKDKDEGKEAVSVVGVGVDVDVAKEIKETKETKQTAKGKIETKRSAAASTAAARTTTTATTAKARSGVRYKPKGDEERTVQCPHCNTDPPILLSSKTNNCGIYRHGVFKNSGKQISPHATDVAVRQLLNAKKIFGCGGQFRYFFRWGPGAPPQKMGNIGMGAGVAAAGGVAGDVGGVGGSAKPTTI